MNRAKELQEMDQAQIKMLSEIERADGAYFVAKDFDSFVEFYKQIISKNDERSIR